MKGVALSVLPIWLQYIQAVALILLPVIGAYIAWKQMQLQIMRLQHDLYDRRFRIYDATRKFLSVALSRAKIEDADFREYALATADAAFVFDENIKQFLADLRTHGSELLVFGPYVEQNLAAGLSALAHKQHAEYVSHKTQAMIGLNQGLDRLEAKFLPYMKLMPEPLISRISKYLGRSP